MDRCRAPFRVPPQLIDTAISLVVQDANAGGTHLFVRCALEEHIEGDHAVRLLFTPDASGRAAWVFWREWESRVQLKDPCLERDSAGEVCRSFAGHSGCHQWPKCRTTSNARTVET